MERSRLTFVLITFLVSLANVGGHEHKIKPPSEEIKQTTGMNGNNGSLLPLMDPSNSVTAYAEDGPFFTTSFRDLYVNHGTLITIEYSFLMLGETQNVDFLVLPKSAGLSVDIHSGVVSSDDTVVLQMHLTNVEQSSFEVIFTINDRTQTSTIFVDSDGINDYYSITSYLGCKQQEFMYYFDNGLLTEDDYNTFVYGDEEQVELEPDDLETPSVPGGPH
ncbi:MAG: hypothetical protein LBR37_01340 [Erysipelotrichaceae bacterium]|jgi:hypothetical protein|nr:hypothetical protein [Erysipelotrichaceae bacterium]